MFCLFQLLPDDLARYAFFAAGKASIPPGFSAFHEPAGNSPHIWHRPQNDIPAKNPIVSCTIESGYPSWKRRRHISPSVRSCTSKDSAPAHVPGGLKKIQKLPLRSFFQNRALTDTVFSNSPLYKKKKAKSSSVKTLHFLFIQGFYAFNPHIQPLFIATVHAASCNFSCYCSHICAL